MKRTHTIQIHKADNGFQINSMSDEPNKNKKLVATDENQARELLKGLAEDVFSKSPEVTAK